MVQSQVGSVSGKKKEMASKIDGDETTPNLCFYIVQYLKFMSNVSWNFIVP